MSGEPPLGDTTEQRSERPASSALVPRLSTWVVWTLFLASVGVLAVTVRRGAGWEVAGVLYIDGLTTVMWALITFFSGIVQSYSQRYMAGDRYIDRFFGKVFAFTVIVGVLVAADHIALFAGAWLAMGLTMAALIGHVRDWKQARAAAGVARRYLIASSALLAGALALLAGATGATTITGILAALDTVPQTVTLAAAGGIFLAAIVQSALFPFHRWLLSSMTAPTPASALMHAGFVNAGGVLLTRFAPVIAEELAFMLVVLVVGATSALLGQAMLLVQTDIKRKLGSSTLAQMGFMILQCGLGFFAAAIAHLILHGFYKAYLFFASGAVVEHTAPKDGDHATLGLFSLVVSLLTALGGGVLFMYLTGKFSRQTVTLDSGMVLALVVALTTLTAARDILQRTSLPSLVRFVGVPLVVLVAISSYAALFTAISGMLSGVPMTSASTELTAVHYLIVALFAGAYLVVELGRYRSSERLYVAFLNLSQPDSKTVLTDSEDYHDV